MKNKKDILFLCQFFYPEYISSATLPCDTAKALEKEGFSVDVICGYPREYNDMDFVPLHENYEGIHIRRLRYIQFKRSNCIGRLINYLSFTISVLIRIGYLRNYKSILVYSNPPVLPLVAGLAGKFFSTKIIFISYDVYPEMAYVTNSIQKGSMISKLMRLVNRTLFKHLHKVVVLSNEMKKFLLENRKWIKDEQVAVIPNWYEDKKMRDVSKSYENEIFNNVYPKENFIISYLGNMGICQDLDTILNAIRQLKVEHKIKFIFAGHGNKLKILKTKVKEEGLDNVIFFDFLQGQDFQDVLNISDCFLVSLADGLTGLAVPSKTYCYMMAGKPVIAIMGMDSDIAKDLIEQKAGYVIEVGQVSELVTVIKDLKHNEQKKEEMGRNCRNIFLKKYTRDKCTKQYVDMMKKVLVER